MMDSKPREKMNKASVAFGYQRVEEKEKPGLVEGVFTSVASRYDVMNDAMTLGLQRLWKSYLVQRLNPGSNFRLLDLAGGTGDISRGFVSHGGGMAIVYDRNYAMIDHGRSLDKSFRDFDRLVWMQGDAESISFSDQSMDRVSIVFGLRNTTHPRKVIEEAFRVLRPGGRFICMDFAIPRSPALRKIYDGYSSTVLPRLGSFIVGDSDSYRYLHESIRTFASPETLVRWFRDTGYISIRNVRLTGGIVAVVSGVRP